MEVVSSVAGAHESTPDWETLTDALVLSFMEIDDRLAIAKLLSLAGSDDRPWASLESIHEACLACLVANPQDPILRRATSLVEAALELRSHPLTLHPATASS
ncbi:MAG: hypothetical protein ACRDJ5_07890 [Actinomycetota bacterium]